MKKVFVIISWSLFLWIGVFLGGCQSKPEPKVPSAIKVLAAESFLADIAQNVAGDRMKVDSLMPLGMDPHGFEPVPQDVVKISESDILLVNGAGFEEWLEKIIKNAGGEHLIIEASNGLKSRNAREGEEAMLSEQEKVEQLCSTLDGKLVDEIISASPDSQNASALHEESHVEDESEDHVHAVEIISIRMNSDGNNYGGYVKIHAEEEGDFVIATEAGNIVIEQQDGTPVEIEEKLILNCNGLSKAVIAELEPAEYNLQLSGFSSEKTLLFAGAAAGHHHHDSDPHFWLDPISVIKYVENIRDGFIQADPTGRDVYTKNADLYIDKLKGLDQFIVQQVNSIPESRRLIVTNHESFGYFADRYKFKIIGTIVPSVSTGSSPSAQQLARLIDHIKSTNAIAIFLETGTNPQLANQISTETGIRVITDLYTHSITSADGPAPTYIDMMKHNANSIIDALK